MSANTLTITDNRTGKQYQVESKTAPSKRWTCARSKYPTMTSA